MSEFRINISEIVGRYAAHMMEPYKHFVDRLEREGRISQDEIQQLRDELLARVDNPPDMRDLRLE